MAVYWKAHIDLYRWASACDGLLTAPSIIRLFGSGNRNGEYPSRFWFRLLVIVCCFSFK